MPTANPLLKSKMFWIGVLYFAEGFPLGVFYEIFPVYFRQQGVELWKIGFMSLLGLAWTLKFLWAPAIDHYRQHRRWMFVVDILMGLVMIYFAWHWQFGAGVWVAIGIFTILSATNDIAIDGYTIEFLERNELGFANGLRIAFYRVGMLASGVILILSDYIAWSGAYIAAAIIFALIGAACLVAPKERVRERQESTSLATELRGIVAQPFAVAAVMGFLLGALWLIERETHWSRTLAYFWPAAFAVAIAFVAVSLLARRAAPLRTAPKVALTEGPMFGALMGMLARPYIVPAIVFILIFKLGDSAMGFMIKPFWVDAGFSATQIGTVSVNLGLVLSIAGGVAGGWYTDRVGIFTALWVLGLTQALSNLGYALAASLIPLSQAAPLLEHKLIIYGASALESFTGGLGTAAFLAFLMAIVDKRHSATEYAILSSVFALSRSLSGWAGGFGAHALGYAPYFLLTFFLAFPAYLLLPWVRKILRASADRAAAESPPAR